MSKIKPKTEPKFTLVRADDWDALYINGKSYSQDHNIEVHTVLEALAHAGIKVDFETKYAYNDPALDSMGRFPEKLSEVTPDE